MGVIAHCQAENARLRELYENVTGNRERFGWTINHLLECEQALRVAEEQLAGTLEALREIVHRAETPCAPHEAPLPYDVAWAEQVAIAKAALDRLGGQ